MILEKMLPWANVAYIVVVALGSYGIYQLNARVNANKDRELAKFQAEANVQIEQANAKAAEANAIAEQARLELARTRQPRTIPPEHRQGFIERLAKHKGQPYELAGAGLDPETMSFLTELVILLNAAGWDQLNSQVGGGVSAFISGKVIGEPVAADVGVTVLIWQKGAGETGEESSSRFAKVGPAKADLINLLNGAGVSTKPGILDLSVKNRNTIRIEVGRKPQPSSTWGRQLGLVPVIESRQEDRNPE